MADQEAEKKSDPREVEWYAAGLAAWYGTRLEHDKNLLTLAAGGIGLLISLVSAFGIESVESLIIFILALFAFTLCVVAVLWIFKRNSKHIEDVVGGQKMNSDPVLAALDNVALSTFLAGVILSSVLGIASAVHSFETKARTDVSVDKKTTGPVAPGERVTVMIGDSVNGMLHMSPGEIDLRKSFSGIANMAPASQGSAQSQATAPAQTSGAASNQTTPGNTKTK
jgi:hypothetical protein